MSAEVTTDYQTQHDEYRTMSSKVGESSHNLNEMISQIVMSCGIGQTLDISSGTEELVASLLHRGIDARGLDISESVVARCNQHIPGRFIQGSVLALPFPDESFNTVVSANSMEHLAPEDVPTALQEMYRITKHYVFLKIAIDHHAHEPLAARGRAWWERKCFETGFRKHPHYYKINTYESLNNDGGHIVILLEKIPAAALIQYPLHALEAECGLHMDMTRDFGKQSDAHIIRYQWACGYIKPGDRVLDAACGLGYGSHLIKHLTRGTHITAIDGSDYAIQYAINNFPCSQAPIEFHAGMLAEALATYPDASFDTIISFETLEHAKDPATLLQTFHRLLTPGGRIIACAHNGWHEESGVDSKLHPLHIYDWARLKSELSAHFILENAWAQTASQCKNAGNDNKWEPRQRSLHPVTWGEHSPADCEWWLMTAMKSPLEANLPYREGMFSNLTSADHPSINYRRFFINPWLMHAMVNSEYRIKDSVALEKLATDVMATYPGNSNDYKAALCVQAYRALQNQDFRKKIIRDIESIAGNDLTDPMALRWKVSLLFVKAKLLETSGDLIRAKETFAECSQIDVREFGIHLATKTTEAAYLAGKIAYSLDQLSEAKTCWQHGVAIGHNLLEVNLTDVLINPDFPNLFNHGDGVREYTVAWDNIARCANGLHLLHLPGLIDYTTLDNSNQTEYAGVTADLINIRQTLVERTEMLERSNRDLQQRTDELIQIRQTLVERTELLEQAHRDLQQRTDELVQTRQALAERTETLAQTSTDLQQRTDELVQTRQALAERTETLEQTSDDLQQRTDELVQTRQALAERTETLEKTSDDLQQRTDELVQTRQTLAERTEMLEQSNSDLQQRTDELVQTRHFLVERTEKLEQTMGLLQQRTEELDRYLSASVFNRIFVRRVK